jgi:hypothetical protein
MAQQQQPRAGVMEVPYALLEDPDADLSSLIQRVSVRACVPSVVSLTH